MDQNGFTAADYAADAAREAQRKADKGNERIAYLEKRVERLEKTVNSLLKDRRNGR